MATLAKRLGAGVAAFAIAGLVVVTSVSGFANAAVGSQSTQVVNVTVPSSITVTNPDPDTDPGTDPTTGEETTDPNALPSVDVNVEGGTNGVTGPVKSSQPVNVMTNNPNGYDLYLTMDSSNLFASGTAIDNSLYLSNSTTPGSNTATSGSNSGKLTATTDNLGTANTWGVQYGSGKPDSVSLNGTYVAVPYVTGSSASAGLNIGGQGTASASAGENYTVAYGANTNSATEIGTYSNTVLYTAITRD